MRQREANADAVIQAAIGCREQPYVLLRWALALQIGEPSDIASLIFALRGKDTRLSEALFGQALVAARQPLL